MSRAALTGIFVVVALSSPALAGIDPHMDPSLVPGSCNSCHKGHGASGSPMLETDQKTVCLRCHDTQADVDRNIARGILNQNARPKLLNLELSKTWTHPVGEGVYTRRQAGSVTCTSCHSPHRSSPQSNVDPTRPREKGRRGGRKLSPANRDQLEYELCESCHGRQGFGTENRRDISRLLNPNSRSFHPVEASAPESSPSVLPDIMGQEISCTDCHGNDGLPVNSGMHGSNVRYILKANYVAIDGSPEEAETYALCYTCHDRELVLDSTQFPLHRLHVVDNFASCSTCHNPHGSVDNRALIALGDDSERGAVSPSISADRLAYESDEPGSGACYLNCHGYDHAPATYGSAIPAAARIPDVTNPAGILGSEDRTSPPSKPPRVKPAKTRKEPH